MTFQQFWACSTLRTSWICSWTSTLGFTDYAYKWQNIWLSNVGLVIGCCFVLASLCMCSVICGWTDLNSTCYRPTYVKWYSMDKSKCLRKLFRIRLIIFVFWYIFDILNWLYPNRSSGPISLWRNNQERIPVQTKELPSSRRE